MDCNQVRDYLEDDEVSGLGGHSATLGPKKLSLHNVDIANRTANSIGYDSRAGLALLQEQDDLALLGRRLTYRRVSMCHRTSPLRRIPSVTLYQPQPQFGYGWV